MYTKKPPSSDKDRYVGCETVWRHIQVVAGVQVFKCSHQETIYLHSKPEEPSV